MSTKPHFETVKSFAEVPITDTGIDSQSFLEASDGLVEMFDLFGSGVFGFVQADIRSNIKGVRVRYQARPESSGTLESLVQSEFQEGSERYATACLVRLVRGLAFTCKALQNMQNDRTAELYTCFKGAYDEVLRHHHSFVIRAVVSVAIRAVPRRDDFYQKLSQGTSFDALDAELARWLVGLDRVVSRASAFLAQGGYGVV